jgi:3-deoxy-D-manno-octulosonate 8-phosphate phosphatase (KDO 8-P phosphatase)
MNTNFKEKLRSVNTFVFDVDGVLTDGKLIVMPDGEFIRTMNIKDGYAMQLCIKKGYKIFIISGGHSKGVPLRLAKLGIREIHMGVTDKDQLLQELLTTHKLKRENVIYMGDDIPDIAAMQIIDVPCCPSDAAPEVIESSIYISSHKGGEGCVRDVIEQTLRLHGKWE